MESDARVLERAECTLHYRTTGPAGAPVLVLTHGATLDHRLFDPQRDALAGRFRVITWDLPGHGASKPMPAGFSLRSAVEDLGAILQREGVQRVTLIGQSMGGDVSQEFAFRFPQRVDRMVLIGCAPVIRASDRMGSWFARLAVWKLRLAPLGRFRRQVVTSAAVSPAARRYAHQCLDRLSRSELVAIWKAIGSSAHEEPDYQLPCPTLLIVGEEDQVGGGGVKDAALAWAERERTIQLFRIPNAGHMANLDAPDAVNDRMLEFLRAPAPSAPVVEA